MRFLVDECTGPAVADWLRQQGHDVFSVYDEARGAKDEAVIAMAFDEDRILVTNDKDFGDRVYRDGFPHCGVVFLRLEDERKGNKITILSTFLNRYAAQLNGRFVVVTERQVRFAGE